MKEWGERPVRKNCPFLPHRLAEVLFPLTSYQEGNPDTLLGYLRMKNLRKNNVFLCAIAEKVLQSEGIPPSIRAILILAIIFLVVVL